MACESVYTVVLEHPGCSTVGVVRVYAANEGEAVRLACSGHRRYWKVIDVVEGVAEHPRGQFNGGS